MNKPIIHFNKRKLIAGQFWKKNESSVTTFSHQLGEVQCKIINKSIHLIENSLMVPLIHMIS